METCLSDTGMTEAVKQNGNLPGKVGMAEGRRDSLEHMLGAAVKQKAHARSCREAGNREADWKLTRACGAKLEEAAEKRIAGRKKRSDD